jgi:hypothetical protein
MPEEREIDQNLESELRQSVGREWVEEAAENERWTELIRKRRMQLEDQARELVHRGQRVRVETGSHTFTGEVVFAGSDYAVVERADDLAAVRLDAATWTIEAGETGGHEQSGGATTLKAHLSELESTGELVRLLVSDGRALVGHVSVVATDHVVVGQDAMQVVVPLGLVVVVVRPRPDS